MVLGYDAVFVRNTTIRQRPTVKIRATQLIPESFDHISLHVAVNEARTTHFEWLFITSISLLKVSEILAFLQVSSFVSNLSQFLLFFKTKSL